MKMYKLILVALLFSLGFISCKKDNTTGQILSPDQLIIGSYLQLDTVSNLNFNFAQIATSAVSIRVRGVGEKVANIISYVSTNNSTDKATWKKIKETVPTNNSATISVTGAELAAALGIAPTAIVPGSQFVIYNEIVTESGKVYNINNTGGGFESAPDFKMAFRFTTSIVCPFTGNIKGLYTIIADQWQDWNPGDIVSVEDGPGANQVNLSKVYPNPNFGSIIAPGLIIDVNPATGAASSKVGVKWADYGGGFIAETGPAGVTGFIFSCTGRINIRVNIIAAGFGNYGNLSLILQKR